MIKKIRSKISKKQQNKDQTAQQDKLKQPEKNKISKEEAERILQALKNNEKDLAEETPQKSRCSNHYR